MPDRRNALAGILAMLASAGTSSANSKDGSEKPWPEKIWTLPDGVTTHQPFGDVTVFSDGATAQLKSLVAGTLLLHPGMEPHPPHQHPEEEFVLITEGHGKIVVGGKTISAAPGALMFSESNQLHGIKNTGRVPLRFYYFKWLAS